MKKQLYIFLFAAAALNCGAQIVNIENQRLRGDKQGWQGNVDLGFSLISNRQQVIQVNSYNRLMYRRGPHSVLGIASFSFVKAGEQDFVNSGFQHLRYGYSLVKHPKLHLEAFEQLQYNKILLLDMRLLGGAGTRITAVDRDSVSLNTGLFVMGEYEEELAGKINRQLRGSIFLSFDYQFTKAAGFNTITYYQPRADDPRDYRISHESSLRFRVGHHFSFRVSYNLTHDERPPEGGIKTTYTILNTLRYEL